MHRQGSSSNSIRYISVAIILITLMTLLSGCGVFAYAEPSVEIGMIETSRHNQTQARFDTLTGRKTWTEWLDAGDTLTLTYDIVLNKGDVRLLVEGPDNRVLWEQEAAAGDSVTGEVDISINRQSTIGFQSRC